MKYHTSIKELLKKFPDYANSEEIKGYDENLPHLIYSGFGKYFRRIVNESSEPLINKKIIEICEFLDDMANSNDKEVIDLLITGFFESVTNEKEDAVQKSLHIFNTLLDKKAKRTLKELVEWRPPIALNRFLLEDDE